MIHDMQTQTSTPPTNNVENQDQHSTTPQKQSKTSATQAAGQQRGSCYLGKGLVADWFVSGDN